MSTINDIFANIDTLDAKSVDSLLKAIEKNNIPGFDFVEFKQSLSALSKMQMEESMAFKSAFATASTVGLTKQKLLESGEFYKSVLRKEKELFDAALINQIKIKVEGKQNEVKKLQEDIEKHKQQIMSLEKQIEDARDVIQSADAVIKTEKEKIDTTKNNFEKAFDQLSSQIDTDLKNINQYIL
jgi:predicted  nucleic acid-binding Zn-ribbon protein